MKNLSPILAGFITAAGVFLINLAVVAVPVFTAQGLNSRTSATTLDALISAINLYILGHGGSVIMTGRGIEGVVKFSPLGLTAVFFLVAFFAARNLASRIPVFEYAGHIRTGAVAQLVQALAGFASTYMVLSVLLSLVGRTGYMAPSVLTALVSTFALGLLAGVLGFVFFLQSKINLQALIPGSYLAIIRGVLISLVSLLAISSLAYAAANVFKAGAIQGLYETLDAELIGNIILTLTQLALAPTLIVWALVVLFGGTVTVGLGTGISYDSVMVGVMPLLPALGVLPEPGEPNPWWQALMILPALATAFGAVAVAKAVRGFELKEKLIAWIGFPVLLSVLILILAALAQGSVGSQQLAEFGPVLSSLMLPLGLLVILPTALVALWFELNLQEQITAQTHKLAAKQDEFETKISGSRESADGEAADDAADKYAGEEAADAEVAEDPSEQTARAASSLNPAQTEN